MRSPGGHLAFQAPFYSGGRAALKNVIHRTLTLGRSRIGTLYIEPGSPWENGYAESFHARLRDELLDLEVFETVAEAQMLAGQWRGEYNERRPHSSLGYRTPAAFAASLAEPSVATLPTAQQATEQPVPT